MQQVVCIGGEHDGLIANVVGHRVRLAFVNADGEFEQEEYRVESIGFGGEQASVEMLVHESISVKEAMEKLLAAYSGRYVPKRFRQKGQAVE